MSKNSNKDQEHDLLGSLLDDEDNPVIQMKHPINQKRAQTSSAPPALFDLGFKISEAFLENEDFDSPDPQDLSIKQAFIRKEPEKFNDMEDFPQLNGYRKMSCDLELLSYYEEPTMFQQNYYQYTSVMSPQQELLSNLGQVSQWAKDQYGSRTVQSIFQSENQKNKDAIFHAIFKDAMNLIRDRFGNYVFQKVFEKGLKPHKQLLLQALWGNIVELSMHPYGCRVIQKSIEFIYGNEEAEQKFINQIRPFPLKLIENQNGNHVIQKCFEIFNHDRIDCLTEILINNLKNLSFHAFGCRVIQKYLQNHREQEKCQYILTKLLDIAIPLSQCQYGNYVMQYIVTKCLQERKKVFENFLGSVVQLSTNKYASNVVEKAIQSPGTQFCDSLADWFMKNQKELIFLAKHQFGNYVVQSMMGKACKEKTSILKIKLKENTSEISKSQYGRHVLLQLQKNRFR